MHVHNLDIFSRFSLPLVYHRKDSLSSIFLPTFVPPGTLARPKRTVPAAFTRAYTSFLPRGWTEKIKSTESVSMPSRAHTSFLPAAELMSILSIHAVSMPSRAGSSFLPGNDDQHDKPTVGCQCPHGLVAHFYLTDTAEPVSENATCQCPLGLIPHFYVAREIYLNAWSSVSMPSRASTSFLPYSS